MYPPILVHILNTSLFSYIHEQNKNPSIKFNGMKQEGLNLI